MAREDKLKNDRHNTLWAIDPKALNALQAKHKACCDDGMPMPEPQPLQIQVINGQAVIPLTGMLLKYNDEICAWLGGTSMLVVQQAIRNCMADSAISGVVLWIDSPGGMVAGTSDLGEEIASATKPVRAVVSDRCCSGAYWIASQCSAIYANSSALIGSIGVYEVLVDTSKMFNDAGVVFHRVRAGDRKGIGATGVPITPEDLASEQKVIDDIYAMFVRQVADGRGMALADAEKLATGEVWISAKALDAGLIDGIKDIDEVLNMPASNVMNVSAVAPTVEAPKPAEAPAAAPAAAAEPAPAPVPAPAAEPVVAVDGGVSDAIKAARQAGYEEGANDTQARFAAVLKACGNRHELACSEFLAGHDAGKALEKYTAVLEDENRRLASAQAAGGGAAPVVVPPPQAQEADKGFLKMPEAAHTL